MTIILDNPKLEQDLPIDRVHPDPVQPRVHPDAELADSIKTQGILQAITVEPLVVESVPDTVCEDCGRLFVELAAEGGHLLILDGERRYRGTIAAGRKTILGKVVPPSTEGARLLRQLTSNTGKPLTPIEEAFAFQRLMEAQGWNQAGLARHLGRPRSVIGDRIRLIDLDSAWLDLIALGKLQVSHGPELHLYVGVPSKYQAEAAKKIREQADESKDPISVDGFHWDLQQAFQPFIRELADVSPQYDGPVIEISQYGGKSKFAADPDLWKPILVDKQKRARTARKGASQDRSSPTRYETPLKKAVKELKAAGIDLPVRKSKSSYTPDPGPGEATILSDSSWEFGIHPSTLLEKLDPRTLILLEGQYGSQKLVTTDVSAVEAAKQAYKVKVSDVSRKLLAPLAAKLTDRVLDAYNVRGPGAKTLFRYLDPSRGDERVVALALGIDIDADDIAQADAERMLAALAACEGQDIKIPNHWTIDDKVRQAVGTPAFKFTKASIGKFVPKNAEPPTSKKQQKREARAAGKQVGDPTRAKVHEDPKREFVETDLELEEELVEA